MPSALFRINSGTAGIAQNVSPSSTVTLTLDSLTGVRTISWEIIGTHSSLVAKPVITPSGTPLGSTASFTVLAGDSQAYGVRCTVNGGRDTNNVFDPDLVYTSAVYVPTPSGMRIGFVGESTEDSPTHGTVDKINYAIINAARMAAIGDANTVLVSTGEGSQWVQISDAYVSSSAAIDVTKLSGGEGNDSTSVLGLTNGIPGWVQPVQPVLDHGGLTGLGDDDHPQYLLVDGSRALGEDLNCDGYHITQLAAPVNATDAVNKAYVDGYQGWMNAAIASNAAISVSKLAPGTDGYVITTVAGVPSWAVGVPTGSANTVFSSNGSANSWSSSPTLSGVVAASSTAGYTTTVNSAVVTRVGDGYVAYGTNPATTGLLRLPNNSAIISRNAANSSDISLIKANSSNNVEVGYGTSILTINNNGCQFSNISNPSISIIDATDNSITGSTLSIASQNCTGTTTTGGDLYLQSGTGTTANGNIKLRTGNTDRVTITPALVTAALSGGTSTFGLAGVSLTGRVADISTVALASTPGAGMYRLIAYMECTTAGSAGTISLTIGWTDNVGATTTVAISGLSVSATGRASAVVPMYVASGSITYATAFAGKSGSPQYTLYLNVERVR